MVSAKANLKRKASNIETSGTAATAQIIQDLDSEDDFGDGILEAVLDDDEDSDDDFDSDGDDQDDDGSDSGDEIASEDIPTDDESGENKSALTNGVHLDKDEGEGEDEDEDKDGRPNYRIEKDANGGIRYVYDEIDPVYDSDDTDAQGPTNTVRVPASLRTFPGSPQLRLPRLQGRETHVAWRKVLI